MASGTSTKFLPENPNEICDSLKILLPEKQAGRNSDIINKEIIVIADKVLDFKCISRKQRKQFLIK